MRLSVNVAKSAVDRPWRGSFLGHGMTAHRKPRLRVAPVSVKRLRAKLTGVFRIGRGRAIGATVQDLAPVLRGWIAYFRLAETKGTLKDLAVR